MGSYVIRNVQTGQFVNGRPGPVGSPVTTGPAYVGTVFILRLCSQLISIQAPLLQ